jgi:hypothetical protein
MLLHIGLHWGIIRELLVEKRFYLQKWFIDSDREKNFASNEPIFNES